MYSLKYITATDITKKKTAMIDFFVFFLKSSLNFWMHYLRKNTVDFRSGFGISRVEMNINN